MATTPRASEWRQSPARSSGDNASRVRVATKPRASEWRQRPARVRVASHPVELSDDNALCELSSDDALCERFAYVGHTPSFL